MAFLPLRPWILLLVAFCGSTMDCAPIRGDKLRGIFPTPEENPRDSVQIRIPRHYKWRNHVDDEDHEHNHPITTTIPVTKSKEQILHEKEEAMKQRNPKGFLMGSNKEKNKGKDIIFKDDDDDDDTAEQIKKMKEAIADVTTSCESNKDCTNQTCCMLDEDGAGKCVVYPHRVEQQCSQQCPCLGDLECAQPDDEDESQSCAKILTPEEKALRMLAMFREGKRNTKG